MKKVLSYIFSIIMLFNIVFGLEITASAQLYSGVCGKNLTWKYDERTKELHISGSGEMWNYRGDDISYPKNEYGEEIGYDQKIPDWSNMDYTRLIIENGVTSIGSAAFKYADIKQVTIPKSVKEIGYQAFYMVKNKLFEVYFEGKNCKISQRAFVNVYPTTVETEKFEGVFYCSKFSDMYFYANNNYIDFCIPDSECSHIVYYNDYRAAYYCRLCGSYMFLDYNPDYVCKEHDMRLIDKKESTCIETGYEKYVCSVCKKSETKQLEKINHNFATNTLVPNCTSSGYTTYTCINCSYSYSDDFIPPTGHSWNGGVITIYPSCTATGVRTYTCTFCGITKTEAIAKTSHRVVTDSAVSATCTRTGKTAGSHCSVCGMVMNPQKTVEKKAHTYKTYTTKATTKKNGSVVTKCTVCGAVKSKSTIYYPKTIKLSKTSYTYNGKVQTPSVTVKDSKGKTLKKNTDYTVTYAKGRKNVGKYAVKITFKGKYSGSKTLYYTIKPKSTSISKLTAGKKKFTVKWKKQNAQATGYQIQYSTFSNFKSAKTVTISKNKTTSKSITKLKAKKKYYVRIRTYKTVGNTKYYSSWSKAKAVTTKR